MADHPGDLLYLLRHLLISLPAGGARLFNMIPVPVGDKQLPGFQDLREELCPEAIEKGQIKTEG